MLALFFATTSVSASLYFAAFSLLRSSDFCCDEPPVVEGFQGHPERKTLVFGLAEAVKTAS